MPRYFFHLRNDVDVNDEEGTDMPDLEAAREKAADDARDMASVNVMEHGKINLEHRIEVTDESGQLVLTVKFGEVVRIET